VTKPSSSCNTPKLSVVIAHFNRAELLAHTLESIRQQSFANWEVIVVDDGSQPDELRRVQDMQDPQIHVLQRTEEPKGPSQARNTGLEYARGDFVMFVDSDDLIAPWCFAQRLQQITLSPENSFWVFPAMLFQQQIGDLSMLWNDLNGEDDLLRFLHSDPPWHTSSPLWKRTALLELGGFNTAVMYGDDADMHTRALLLGMPYQKFPQATPDSFVRRDDSPRITNTLSDALVESRRIRLREGSKAIAKATPDQQLTWEGQYFSEAEFLLFNVTPAAPAIRQLMSVWSETQKPTPFRWFVARLYLSLAMLTRTRLYIVLRLARRLAMRLLPRHYFPGAPGFQNTPVSPEMEHKINAGLSTIVTPQPGDVDATVSA
jgi:hypothetical protein